MKRLGKQESRYDFCLNPYQDQRFTRCPKCQRKMKQRKLPLVIHVEPQNLMVLNKTCRYCPSCDLLIAHQDEIEAQLAGFFTRQNPAIVGNAYLVLGTVDRPAWERGTQTPVAPGDMLDQMHDFKEVLQFKLGGGWVNDESAQGEPPKQAKTIDDRATATSLLKHMEANLPIPAYPTPELARALREREVIIHPNRPLSIEQVFDAGDEGGICCGLAQQANAKEAIVVSLTHLRIPASHPLAHDIQTYQRDRVKRIGRSGG